MIKLKIVTIDDVGINEPIVFKIGSMDIAKATLLEKQLESFGKVIVFQVWVKDNLYFTVEKEKTKYKIVYDRCPSRTPTPDPLFVNWLVALPISVYNAIRHEVQTLEVGLKINRKLKAKFSKKYLKDRIPVEDTLTQGGTIELVSGRYYRNKANEIVQMMQKNLRGDGSFEYVDHLGNIYLENGKVIAARNSGDLNELVGEVT